MLDNQGYLKLKANDKNDLKVFAAYLQDSITVPQDIKYLEKTKHSSVYLIDLCGKMQRRGFSEITRGLDRH